MKIRLVIVCTLTSVAMCLSTGCAVSRDQETVGAYIDDSVITTSVKSRLFDDKTVDSSAISVETLNGTVMLSGFVKNVTQKNLAETISLKVKGVKSVKNEISVK